MQHILQQSGSCTGDVQKLRLQQAVSMKEGKYDTKRRGYYALFLEFSCLCYDSKHEMDGNAIRSYRCRKKKNDVQMQR